MKIKYMIFALLLSFSTNLPAQDISGKYFMNANGHTFSLVILQDGDLISGKMYNISNTKSSAQVSTISGRIEAGRITFKRKNILTTVPQEYEGYLFRFNPDPSIAVSGMGGVFSDMGLKEFAWYAIPD